MNRKTIAKMCLCEFSDKKGDVLFARRARSGCKPEGLTRDEIFDNITLSWLTNTAISSVRLYWDTAHNLPAGGFFDARDVKLPVGVSAFAEEIYQAPKSCSEEAYVKLIHYSEHPKGTTSRPANSLAPSCPICAQPQVTANVFTAQTVTFTSPGKEARP